MASKQKLRQIYNDEIQNIKQIKQIGKVLKNKLGINLYQASVVKIWQLIAQSKQKKQQPEKLQVSFEDFCLLVQLIQNPFEKSMFQMLCDTKRQIKDKKQQLTERDLKLRDRQSEGKVKIKIGSQRQYKNQIKLTIQKNKGKKLIVPWVSFEFLVKQKHKGTVQKLLRNCFQKIFQLLLSEYAGSQSSLKQIIFEVNQTKRGVMVVIQMKNQKFNEFQLLSSCFYDQIFQTQVQGKIKLNIKLSNQFTNLIDHNKMQSVYHIFSKNCQINTQWSVAGLMTGIKQLILHLRLLIDLQLNRFHPICLLVIMLTNTQNLEGQFEFQNTQFTQQQQEQFNQLRLQLLERLNSTIQQSQEFFQQFHLTQIIKYLQDQIFIQLSLGKLDISTYIRIHNLKLLLQTLFRGSGQNEGSEQDQSRKSSAPQSSRRDGDEQVKQQRQIDSNLNHQKQSSAQQNDD